MTTRRKTVPSTPFLAAVAALGFAAPAHAQSSCPLTSDPKAWTGSALGIDTTRAGTVFNTTGSGRLELSRNGETFGTKQMTSTSDTVYAAVADFNKDGWQDFVGAPQNASTSLNVFRNFTWQNENCTTAACTAYSGPAPDFTNPAVVVTPKFSIVRQVGSYTGGRFSLIAADFNGDTWPDIFAAHAPDTDNDTITSIKMYLNSGANDSSGNPQFGSAYTANTFTISNTLGDQTFSGTNIKAVDYNKDGRQDILIGTDKSNGSIRILLNNCTGTMQASGVLKCTSNPQFTDGGFLIANLSTNNSGFGSGNGGLPVFDYADIDLDGLPDLVVGAANCCTEASYRARLFKGCSGGTGCEAGLEKVASQSLTFTGAATAVFIADFSLDGRPDLVLATDGKNYNTSVNGGTAFYYRNNGTNVPFSAGVTKQIAHKGTTPPNVDDFDVGIVFDYDRDPTHSPDMMVANGNDSAGYYVIADRLSPNYVECGDAYSGSIDLGNLINNELVVTAARITPSLTLNGGSATFYLSNEEPANWVQANLCANSTTDYCVSFPKPIGRSVRWKAVMCSNSFHTTTPTLSSMSAKFDYSVAREHYRAGMIVNDGVAYVGAFHQPGERGRFYAVNAGLSDMYWDAGAKLDASADGSRNIFTAATTGTRIDFATSRANDPQLQSTLGTADTAATSELIQWVRSPRFGVGGAIPLTRLGAVETSTPAILAKPNRPTWYAFATGVERQRVDTFIAANTARKPLVLFGAKDGMLHAVHTRPTEITNSINGSEAWAYIPPTVASRMLGDRAATLAANAAANNGTNNPKINAYPDGSPTLADIHVGNGVYKTIAAIAEGNGGKSFSILDVTETVDMSTGAVRGPSPMWTATPGDSEAGQAYAKPVVVRVRIATKERYIVIAGTGIDFTDTLGKKGRIVAGYDAVSGKRLWKFEAACTVTSDLAAFETDDTAELGQPTLDGYVDRVVFADKCGYVYKLAPNVDLDGAFYENTDMAGTCLSCPGSKLLANTTTDGKKQYALFSTKSTSGALGQDRAIAGTIAARTDSSTRMVLFFGTGGIESVAANLANEFYAVYADTGAIRSKLAGGCTEVSCEKFYGGIIVTPSQVFFTKTVDPKIGSGTCDLGSSTLLGMKLDGDATGAFVSSGLAQPLNSAVVGGLFGDAGAIYFATLSGEVARIGTPRAMNAGDDSVAGVVQQVGDGDRPSSSTTGSTAPYTLMGWRVVM